MLMHNQLNQTTLLLVHRTARFFIPKDMNDWDKELPSEWHGKSKLWNVCKIHSFLFYKAWLRKRRDNPPTQEESQRNLDRIERFKPKEETSQTTESEVTKSKFSKFPIYKEYEETPGAKYK